MCVIGDALFGHFLDYHTYRIASSQCPTPQLIIGIVYIYVLNMFFSTPRTLLVIRGGGIKSVRLDQQPSEWVGDAFL